MADKTTTSQKVVVDLTLTRGDDMKSRRLSFDNFDSSILPDVKDYVIADLKPSLVGGGLSTFIQPSGWRDLDISEEEYTCTALAAKIVTTSEVELDLG